MLGKPGEGKQEDGAAATSSKPHEQEALDELIKSLKNDNEQMAGGGISVVLKRYAPDSRVLDIASTKEALKVRLNDILEDGTFILPMHVNVVSGNYEVQGNHYTGLVIKRLSAPGTSEDASATPCYSIQYI